MLRTKKLSEALATCMTRLEQCWQAIRDHALESILKVVTSPYYLLYDRNTRSHIVAIVRAEADDNDDLLHLVEQWLDKKNKEAQYVQVAGAIMFTSAISSLSWTDITGKHWTGPACWYVSIILSMVAVLSAAQQTMLIGSLQQVPAQAVKSYLRKKDLRVDYTVVFAWQAPLMFLSYSLLYFVAGLTSHVASPVARMPMWNDSAKTLVLYVIATAFAFLTFAGSSRLVYHTLPDDSG